MRAVRIQRKRVARYSMHAQSRATNGLPCKSVARPGPFGNPFKWQELSFSPGEPGGSRGVAVRKFREWFYSPEGEAMRAAASAELKGHNLACYCPLYQHGIGYTPCHADVLLAFLNEIPEEEVIRENIRRSKREESERK